MPRMTLRRQFAGVNFGQFALGSKTHADLFSCQSIVHFGPLVTLGKHEKSSARLAFELLDDFFGQPGLPVSVKPVVSVATIFNHLTKAEVPRMALHKVTPSKEDIIVARCVNDNCGSRTCTVTVVVLFSSVVVDFGLVLCRWW